MAALLAIVLLGFVLGMRHATDPDHVVAVSTIVSKERTILQAVIVGAVWGLGHTITILFVGSAIIMLKFTVPPRLGLSMELSVAFMLILLGVLNLTGVMRRVIEWFTIRAHGSGTHSHVIFGRLVIHTHGTEGEAVERGYLSGRSLNAWRRLGWFHILRPFIVGIVHGLAGSAAVGLLVLTTINRPAWAMGYLLVFGLGTISGMMLITAAIALPFAYTFRHFLRLNQGLSVASGVISLSFGLFLCYQVGIVNGLFTGHLNWVPR
jgi:high-affinity nickel permease